MKLRDLSLVAVLAFAVFAPSEGLAAWTQNTTFSHAAATSLKITEPAGFKVTVMVDGKPVEDTAPMVVNLPHADAYLPVTVTAPDGKSWSGKVEVKARQQTLVTFKYTPEAGPAPAPGAPVRKFVGKVWNPTDKCGAKDQSEIKFEFLAGGQKVQEHVVGVGQANNAVEMPEASDDVRVYTRPAGGQWNFVKTITPFAVSKDGWVADYGCTPKAAPARRR
jgi:hypothetical protein